MGNLFKIIQEISRDHKIIQISGESGTGKTTLALQLVECFLTSSFPYIECCIWVQASEIFPKKRLARMFNGFHEKFHYLQKNIFITPQSTTISSYDEQFQILSKLSKNHTILPPKVRCIVIDNISHHLRYEISKSSNIKTITSIIDKFYEYQLMPIIMLCQIEGIYLILIHEVTYDPNSGGNRSFLSKLYYRLNTIKIELSYRNNRHNKKMEIFTQDQHWNFDYTLLDCGLVIL